MLQTIQVLLRIAVRHLFARRVNLVVGALIMFSTVILVVLSTFRSDVQRATSRTLIKSFVGQAQLYSAESTGELSLYALQDDGAIMPIRDFARVRARLLQQPNVRDVIAMGTGSATYVGGAYLDELLDELRAVTLRRQVEGTRTPRSPEQLKALIRHVVATLAEDARDPHGLVDLSVLPEGQAALATVNGEEFWRHFDQAPSESLELLENKVAPLLAGDSNVPLSIVGLNLDQLASSFEVDIVDGQKVPAGHRGLLLSKYVYEDNFKLKLARKLDVIADAIGRGRNLDEDDELKRWVRNLAGEIPQLLMRLPPDRAPAVLERLRPVAPKAATVAEALAALLQVDGKNFQQRYDLFYSAVVPAVDLYSLRPGDLVPLRAHARSGYVKSLRVRFYGTYKLQGLSASHPPARDTSLLDLISLNELLGYLSQDEAAEVESLRHTMDVRTRTKEELAAAVFAPQTQTATAEAEPRATDEAPVDRTRSFREQMDRTYTREQMEAGVVLDAAVWLKDPSTLDATVADLRRIDEAEKLGIVVVPWQKAAGLLSTLTGAVTMILLVVLVVLFAIVAFVLNNTMMMVTLQRTKEFGTLRAIGGGRGFVLAMVLLEGALAMLVFGGAGAGLGALLLSALGRNGLPAPDPDLDFFFGGPRLYPALEAGNFALALATVVVIGLAATLYPAWMATRVPPIRAMQSED